MARTDPRRLAWSSLVTLALASGCGGNAASPAGALVFAFGATGLEPRSLSVAHNGCVTVRNSDTVNHDVTPDDLVACPELLESTTLTPGEEWVWCGFQGGPKSCAFHDSTRTLQGGAPDPSYSATILVRAP